MQSDFPSDTNKKLENLEQDTNSHRPQEKLPYEDKMTDEEASRSDAATAGMAFPSDSKSFVGHIKYSLSSIRDWLKHKRGILYNWLNARFGQLTFSQWCYFVAFVVMIDVVNNNTSEDSDYIIVGVIAGLGLIRELLHVFNKIWEHTLGKGVLLVLYAATANFALAISALKINSISGIEPSIFVFTMGFTTLLMLPFWILVASVIFLGSAIVIGNLWLLLGLLLRIIGVKIKLHWEDQSFAVITMIFRFVLIPFLIYVLLHIMNPYLKQMDMFEVPLGLSMFEQVDVTIIDESKFNALSKEELTAITQQIRNPDAESLPPTLQQKFNELTLSEIEIGIVREMSDADLVRLIDRLKQSPTEVTINDPEDKFSNGVSGATYEAPGEGENSSELTTDSQASASEDPPGETEEEAETRVLDNLIARFIYRFETYPYSSCEKEEYQRVLPFDEDSMLVAERDDSTETGVKFFVAPCEPAYYKDKNQENPRQTGNQSD